MTVGIYRGKSSRTASLVAGTVMWLLALGVVAIIITRQGLDGYAVVLIGVVLFLAGGATFAVRTYGDEQFGKLVAVFIGMIVVAWVALQTAASML